jgi:hypothetical protein
LIVRGEKFLRSEIVRDHGGVGIPYGRGTIALATIRGAE